MSIFRFSIFQRLALILPFAALVACSGSDPAGTGGGTGGDVGTGGAGANGGTGGIPFVDCEVEIGFEDGCGPFELADFDGAVTAIIDNPDPSGINTTRKVVQMQKFDGEIFAGSTLALDETIDWSRGTAFTTKVWSSRPVNLLFKLEGAEIEREDAQTDPGVWQEVCVDFAGQTDVPDTTGITFIFDFGLVGKAQSDADNWTFYFDGIRQTDECVRSEVNYELIFEDEFDSGEQPSSDTWNFETGYGPENFGWGNNEWQLYTNSTENVRLEDGNLVIEARCTKAPEECGVRDDSITSARLTTEGKFEFRYGKVQARIKPPVGRGAWPAFWALGANFSEVNWPFSGEIDFMEMHNAFSNDRTTHFTMHWCDQSTDVPEPCARPVMPGEGWTFITRFLTFEESLGDDFHIFEAEWDENAIIGKIDGIPYYIRSINPTTMEEFQRDFFLILNVAMGGTLGSNNQPPSGQETYPQTMLVDWVRVYQRVDEP